jgi:cell division topological specificity factor
MRFLKRLSQSKPASSREVAKERLQLVLVHDRAQISPQLLQELKDEIIAVISKHVAIDHDGVDITLTQNRRESRLQAEIPLRPRSRKSVAR